MAESRRVGQGWDRHRLAEGEELVVGGVTVPSSVGTVGHSDGDVLLHAVLDALLGAAGWGDIGDHFPSSDPRWSDASSVRMVRAVLDRLGEERWEPVNIDCSVLLERPRLAPYRESILGVFKEVFGTDVQYNCKFKTGDQLGPVGRGEAVEAQAIALLRKNTG